MGDNRSDLDAEMQKVRSGIEMYQVLLKSVEDSAHPDEALREEYSDHLINLRGELETLQPQSTWDYLSSESGSLPGEADARSQSTLDARDGTSSSTSYQNQVPASESLSNDGFKQPHLNGEHGIFHHPPADSASTSQLVQKQALPTRKRPFSGEHDYSFSKSRRATPSPAISVATTPSSVSEFDDLLANLLGSEVRQDVKEYERAQREWEIRQQQEIHDAELAQSIQDSWNAPSHVPKPQPASAFQTSLAANGPSLWVMPPPPVPQVKAEPPLVRSQLYVKSEGPASMPGAFPLTQRNGSDDSDSSSDLEEISSFAFVARTKPEPNIKPESTLGGFYGQGQPWNNVQSAFLPQSGGIGVYDSPASVSGTADYSAYPTYGSIFHGNAMSPLDKVGGHHVAGVYPAYSDPNNTHEELKKLLANIKPDDEVKPEAREGTPEAMKCTLMEHQKLGLTWMKGMEDSSSKGGILADDMGLGKTVQALSLIVSRKSEDPAHRTTLIVAPVALMGQWAREISKLVKRGRHSLTVETLHSNTRDLKWSSLREKDVVLTTYGTLASELKRKAVWEEKVKRVPNAEPGRGEHLPLLGEKSKWYRVILDEAQWIKNKSTKTSHAACHLQSQFRWCLTGTPMQNSVDELYSLIRFLKIAPYHQWEKFSRDFSRPLKSRNTYGETKDNAMQQLQALCKATMLRRTKTSKIDGKPILQLPEKTIDEQHAVFSKDEHEFYQALENRAQITFNRYVKAGTVGRNYSNALVLLLRLRQACCHPHLIKDFEMETGAATEATDKLANASTLPPDVVERLKQIEAFECPICFDAAINSLIFNPCGHPSCNECFDRLATQAHANADYEGGSGLVCPTCRGKVNPAKMTDFQSFKKTFGRGGEGDDEAAALLSTNDDADSNDSATDSDLDSDGSEDDMDEDGNLAGFVVPDDQIDEHDEGDGANRKVKDKMAFKSGLSQKGEKQKSKGRRKGKGKASSIKHLSLADLRKEGVRNKAAKKRYLRRLEKNFQTSAKIEKAVELLEAIEGRGTREKTIVFSQFTSLLDLLEVPLSRKDIQYKRYDGSMKPRDREEAVMTFTDDPRYTVLLVSLKAGNSGLNLTVASQVIIFDPHWNWYTEAQAIDRAYRIGQTRPVNVHRLLIPDTVEDRILALQEKKKELIETALDENAAKDVSRLGVRELGYLFGVNSL